LREGERRVSFGSREEELSCGVCDECHSRSAQPHV
jgi:hypothetical protein